MTKTQQIAFLHSERLSIPELALAVGMPANRVRWELKELGEVFAGVTRKKVVRMKSREELLDQAEQAGEWSREAGRNVDRCPVYGPDDFSKERQRRWMKGWKREDDKRGGVMQNSKPATAKGKPK